MAVSQSLTLTESNVSANDNTSKVRILWKSTQSGDSWNGNTRTAKYYVSINGGTETEYSVSYTLPKNATATIVDKTITVTHSSNGTGSVKVRTEMDTRISAGVVKQEKTITLTTIPRASTIDSLACATKYFSGNMTYKYTPKSSGYYNRCNISLNVDGEYTLVKSIDIGKKSASQQTASVTLTEDELETIYNELTSTDKGVLRFTIRTYSDSGYSNQIGSVSYKELTLYIPGNENTKPSLTVTVTPVEGLLPDAFGIVFVKGRSKATVTITAEGKYGAEIKSYSANIGGTNYSLTKNTDGSLVCTTDWLNTSGEISVVCTATDSRGFTTKAEPTFTVLPYSKPKVLPASNETEIICKRYDIKGVDDDLGTYLRVKVKKWCDTNVYMMDGTDNRCKIDFRLKTDIQNWDDIEWTTIHSKTAKGNEIDTYELAKLGIQELSTTTSYVAQIKVTDDIGEYSYVTITIPTAQIYSEEDGARRSFAFGEYVQESNTFSIAEDIAFKVKTEDGVPTVVKDTGWKELGLSSNVKATSSNNGRCGTGCFYRVINENHVFVEFNCSFTYSGSEIYVLSEQIPSAYCPKGGQPFALCGCNGRHIAWVHISTAGRLVIDAVQLVSSAERTTSATIEWIDGYIDYFI